MRQSITYHFTMWTIGPDCGMSSVITSAGGVSSVDTVTLDGMSAVGSISSADGITSATGVSAVDGITSAGGISSVDGITSVVDNISSHGISYIGGMSSVGLLLLQVVCHL